MSLKLGNKFRNYEIVAPIGAGGMGEVYRARDTKLGRDVAVKVLPAKLSRDKDRLARFEREARLLAQLNHTNIATIHGLEEHDGQHVLVMELVEGETLAAQIARGPLAIDDVVAIFTQIAEGLEAAHDKGIIHRDLKPANVMITPAGHVKILDFGLAKAYQDETSPVDDASQSPTVTKGTELGVILGTASYMSPEQARGKQVDKRTDLWAFGCCLYEALTARKAFVGETTTDTLAAIVNAEPNWNELPAATPTPIRRLLRRCLTKPTTDRLGDAGTARLELLEREVQSTEGASKKRRRPAVVGLGGLALVAVTAALTWWVAREPSAQPLRRVAITPEPGYTIAVSSNYADIDISPDGRWIAYVATDTDGENRLFLRAIDEYVARPVDTETADPQNPRFTPDSQWLGYFDAVQGRIMRVGLNGERAETFCEAARLDLVDRFAFRGFDWDRHGGLVLAQREVGLQRCIPGEPALERLTTVDSASGEINHESPHVLPTGDAVIFGVVKQSYEVELAVITGTAGAHRLLGVTGKSPRYVHGHVVYGLDTALRAIELDLRALDVVGSSFHVLTGVTTTLRVADFAVSSDGTLLYLPQRQIDADTDLRTLAWVDRNGTLTPLAAQPMAYTRLQIAPSGDRVALDVRSGSFDVWTWDFARETLTRVTFDPAIEGYPAWVSNDRLLFESHRVTQGNVHEKAADGTGTAELVVESLNHQIPLSVSSDGKWAVLEDRPDDRDLGLLSFESGMLEPLLATDFNETNAAISPGGNFLAYQSDESGQYEIYVRPFPKVDANKWRVSRAGGTHPLWSKDGNELFFLDGVGSLVVVDVTLTDVFTNGRPKKILDPGFAVESYGQVYDVSRDGARFLTIQESASRQTRTELRAVLNWFGELERLAAEAE